MPEPSTSPMPRGIRIAVSVALGIAFLALALHAGVALTASHSITQVESIIAIQAGMLARGEGLYWDLNSYPYTVSPYGPMLYCTWALLQKAGLPVLLSGRLISIFALAMTLWLARRLLGHWGVGLLERRTGLALLASAGVIGNWGVVAQSDSLALMFSVAALERYARYEQDRRYTVLAAAGMCILLAILTKQSFLAAGAAITASLFLRETRRGLVFTGVMTVVGIATALGVNALTGGGYLENALLANLNPFAWSKLALHLEWFLPVSGSLALVALSGFARPGGFLPPLHLYTAFSAGMWLVTAPKIGSDLNYQLEPTLALCLAAAWSLDRLRFFDLLARRDPGWVTLLQIPLLLHLVLNAGVAVQSSLTRIVRNRMAQQLTQELAPWLDPARGRLLSVEIDPLLHAGRPLEVEPLIYTLLVDAGVTDPAPVQRDLASGAFATVLLYQDLADPATREANPELPSLPAAQLDIIRTRYRLAAHIPGPLAGGVYAYERSGDAPAPADLQESSLRMNLGRNKGSSRWSDDGAGPYARGVQ